MTKKELAESIGELARTEGFISAIAAVCNDTRLEGSLILCSQRLYDIGRLLIDECSEEKGVVDE